MHTKDENVHFFNKAVAVFEMLKSEYVHVAKGMVKSKGNPIGVSLESVGNADPHVLAMVFRLDYSFRDPVKVCLEIDINGQIKAKGGT